MAGGPLDPLSTGSRLALCPLSAGPLPALRTRSGSTVDKVHGFVANTANYSVLHEEFCQVGDVINGQPVIETPWVDWNHFIDEVPYVEAWPPL